MIDFVKVGQKITAYRKNANLTQSELADKLFVTRQALSKWELGVGVPSVDSLLNLCQLFAISFEELLCLNEEKLVKVDCDDIFQGRDRTLVIHQLIQNQLDVNIPDILYQLSPYERMVVLKAIKQKKITCNQQELISRLTPEEKKFMNEHFHQGGKRK